MDYRKKGVASSLMNDIMNFITKNFPEFSIFVVCSNLPVEFYQSLWF